MPPSSARSRWICDVVLADDLRARLAGASVAAEGRALANAGYRVGLLHLPAPDAELRPFAPAVLGELRAAAVQLLVGTRPVAARLLVVRGGALSMPARDALARVRPERTLLVVGEFGAAQPIAPMGGQVELVPRDLAALAALVRTAKDLPFGGQVWPDLAAPDADGDGTRLLVDHVRQLIGEPSEGAALYKPPAGRAASKPTVLFASSNGAGLGHLTRLMAMARRAAEMQPIFFTLSQAVPVVRAMGFPCEYFASSGYSGMPTGTWNRLYAQRLAELIETYRPAAVVFDGTYPYQGLVDVANRWPRIPFVWSRRGLWREGRGALGSVERARHFGLVIEPGELARELDRGLTAAHRAEALQVGPVVLLDPDELLPADEARAHLGLSADRPAVLVTLGAGNINDLIATVDLVVRELALARDALVCVTSSIIAERHGDAAADSVQTISEYPLSRFLRAFDCAVSASGYNSFHELVGFGVPTLFLPNLETSLDDQAMRARFAAQSGVGLWLEEESTRLLREALAILLDPARQAQMRARCGAVWPGNGAAGAMAAVEALAARGCAGVPAVTGG